MKVYIVTNIVQGQLTKVRVEKTLEKSMDLAIKMAQEQCDTPQAEIVSSMNKSWSFYNKTNEINVEISTTDVED